MNKELSKKIVMSRFPLMVGIVFVHACFGTIIGEKIDLGDISSFPVAFFTMNLFGQVWGRMVVPFFFLLSGYLLYYRTEPSLSVVKEKFYRRLFSLVLPYVLVNLLILGFVTLYRATGNQAMYEYFYYINPRVWPYCESVGLCEGFMRTFGIGHDPVAFQLWFLRDLIVLTALSPLLHFLMKRLRWIYAITVVFLWINPCSWQLGSVVRDGIVPFSAGLYFSYRGWEPVKIRYGFVFLCIYLVTSCVEAYWFNEHFWPVQPVYWPDHYIHKLNIVVGILAFWYLMDLAYRSQRLQKILSALSIYAFWLYLFHEPMTTWFKPIALQHLNDSTDIIMVFSYIFYAFFMVAVVTFLGWLVKHTVPAVFRIVCGNRKAHFSARAL